MSRRRREPRGNGRGRERNSTTDQPCAKLASRAFEPILDRGDADAKALGKFLPTEPFDLAENQHFAERRRQPGQLLVERLSQFPQRSLGRRRVGFDSFARGLLSDTLLHATPPGNPGRQV